MLYIKIKTKDSKRNISKSFIGKVFSFFIPKANPDYEEKIFLVVDWLLEFENENSIPKREIGINSDGEVIVKMPYKDNYGYWIDNTLTIQDFKTLFDFTYIDKDLFLKKWSLLE